MRTRPHNQAGFTLVEVLIAVTIAGFAMVALMRLMSTSLDGGEIATRATTALLIAESRLAAAGIESPLQPGRTNGGVADGYRWTMNVRPFDGLPDDAAERVPVEAFEVSISVHWAPDRDVSLTALRLQPREAADDRLER